MLTTANTVGEVAIASKKTRVCLRRRNAVAIPPSYRNRPCAVRVAIYKVWENSAELGFTQSMTAVLQAIIAAGVSASKPFTPIFAKKATLAKMACCSEISVYRAMRRLESGGWITRSDQARLDDGSMDIGLVSITEQLALLTGFRVEIKKEQIATEEQPPSTLSVTDSVDSKDTTAKFQSTPVTEQNNSEEIAPLQTNQSQFLVANLVPENDHLQTIPPKMTDGLIDGAIRREQRGEPKASVYYQSTRPEFVRIEGRTVAQELLWLINEKRLTFGGLFQLQTLAKEVPGQTLADFVNYRSERLKQLPTTNDCYRYLKKLITDGIDAKHLYNQRLKKEHNTKRRQQRNEAASNRSAWCQKMHGKIIVNPKTNVALKINANYGLLEAEDRNSKNQTIKITGSLIKALDAGRLIVRQEQAVDKEVASRHLNAIYSKLPWLRLKKNLSIPQIS